MCVESSVGATGIVLGASLMGLGISTPIEMTPLLWVGSVFIVTLCGFLIKDWVFQWNPWRFYKEKDHINIVFSWEN
jgi:hypothetical protein